MNPPKLRTGFVSAGAGAAGALALSTLALLLSIFAFGLSTPCADAGPDVAESTAVASAAERMVRSDVDVMGLSPFAWNANEGNRSHQPQIPHKGLRSLR